MLLLPKATPASSVCVQALFLAPSVFRERRYIASRALPYRRLLNGNMLCSDKYPIQSERIRGRGSYMGKPAFDAYQCYFSQGSRQLQLRTLTARQIELEIMSSQLYSNRLSLRPATAVSNTA